MWNTVTDIFTERNWASEILMVLFVVLCFNLIVKNILKAVEQRCRTKQKFRTADFFKALYTPLSLFVWIFAGIHTVNFLNNTVFFSQRFSGHSDFILTVTAVLCTGWFLLRVKKYFVLSLQDQHKIGSLEFNTHRIHALDKLLTIVIVFSILIILLDVSGRGIGALLTIGGIGAAAIGFASKEFIANFFGGFMLYLNTPFFVGDLIEIPDRKAKGYVEEIGWYLTRIRDLEKQPIFLPNALFSQFVLINLSKRTGRRITETLDLRYKDFSLIKDILEGINTLLKTNPDVNQRQSHRVNFIAFGESSLQIEMSCYTRITDQGEYNKLKETLLTEIYHIVRNAGADFAYPTITIDSPPDTKGKKDL